MKKAKRRTKKRTEHMSRPNPEIDEEAMKIQRTVGDSEAFYFYEAIGKPTGEIAKNLSEFLGKVKSLNQESLMFHHTRQDFQHWIEKTIGDSKLAKKLGKINSSNSDDVRKRICRTVENRLEELQAPMLEAQVSENLAALQPSS